MKQIVVCGASKLLRSLLSEIENCQLRYIEDEHFERGEVKLVRGWERGEKQPDLVLVGYPGAAGLAACDFLYRRNNAPPILWHCDREEFAEEAGRMGVGFLHEAVPRQSKMDCIAEYLAVSAQELI
ncbi:MAG: hypothetical protein IJN16_00025 [Lachnospiraceae bacterium]|nr:hypothetical protein [Lachnospiraceae bacterium]